MIDIAPLVLSTILKDFFTSFIVESKILQNHWLRNYFVKLVDRGECKIIGTRLTMIGRRIVEFLHKRTCQIFSLLAFGELWFLSLLFTFSRYFGSRTRNFPLFLKVTILSFSCQLPLIFNHIPIELSVSDIQ